MFVHLYISINLFVCKEYSLLQALRIRTSAKSKRLETSEKRKVLCAAKAWFNSCCYHPLGNPRDKVGPSDPRWGKFHICYMDMLVSVICAGFKGNTLQRRRAEARLIFRHETMHPKGMNVDFAFV